MKKVLFLIGFIFYLLFIFTHIKTVNAETECETRGGECKSLLHNICPSGYESNPIGKAGELGCKITEHCCIKLKSGCHTWLFGCEEGYSRCEIDPLVCCQNLENCPSSAPREFLAGIQPTECDTPAGPKTGIQTALGCIPTKDTTQFVGWLLESVIKIAGGIAFLLIIFGAIKVLTSSGNPEAVKAGQEMITSALMGLIFIIFSLFLLELIGVKILKIPGFGQE